MPLCHVRDISDFQPSVDWRREKTQVAAVAIKASEALTWTSKRYPGHVRGARSVGLPVIPYHFVRAGSGTPKAQIAHFAAAIGARPSGRPMLDVESNPNGLDAIRFSAWLWAAVNECKRLYGAFPIIYTSPGLWGGFLARAPLAANFKACPLWVAHYGVAHPTIPWPWSSAKLWQWTSGARDPAIPGRVDDSFLYGPLAPLLLPTLRPRTRAKAAARKATNTCA